MASGSFNVYVSYSMRIIVDAHDAIQAHIPLLVTLLSRQDADLRFSIIETLSKISVDSRYLLLTFDYFWSLPASFRARVQLAILYLSHSNLRLGLQNSFRMPLIESNQSTPQSFIPSKSLFVQEFNELAEENDIEKWFDNRRSLWALTYFRESRFRREQKVDIYIHWIQWDTVNIHFRQ
jgi:hypothetical protein